VATGTIRGLPAYHHSGSLEWYSSMRTSLVLALFGLLLGCSFAATAEESNYSKAVRQACSADYHKHCGEYGLETAALRNCMDKAGHSLSKSCVNALVAAGEVSQAEVDRRRKSGR
jgi:hypothetical protein